MPLFVIISFGWLIVIKGRLGSSMGKTNRRPKETLGHIPFRMMIENSKIVPGVVSENVSKIYGQDPGVLRIVDGPSDTIPFP